ncbi:MAG: hypothetical protein ACK5LK_09760 [Chthoniobacterales bacterium]
MIPKKELENFAGLYDRFANAIDPFSEDRNRAEEKLKLHHALNSPFFQQGTLGT